MKNLKIGIIAFGLLAVTQVSAQEQAQRERKTPEEKFQKLDANQDGQIDKAEFMKAAEMRAQKMADKGKEPKKGNPEDKFAKLDTDDNGLIDLKEFQMIAERKEARKDPKNQFNKMDTDQNGKVTLAEYQSFMAIKAEKATAMGKDVRRRDVDKRFIAIDTNKDNAIDLNEYVVVKERQAKREADKLSN